MDVLSEIVLSIARSSGLSPLDESVLRGPVAATSGSAQAQRLLRVVESVLRLREATGSDDSAEPLLEHIRGRLPVNRMGNTIEDVWWRLARLVRMHVPAAPSIQWNDWATYWGSDWPEFIDTVVTGFGLSAPPDSRQAWGVMALDILEHSTIELLPVAEVENLSDEAVYKSLEAMGARFRWRRGSTPAHLQMADENLVRCLRRIEVQFGSNLGIRTPRPTPGTFYTYAGVSAIWILGLGTLLSLSMFGWFFAALLASGYVLTLARSHDWRPIQTTFAALDRRDLRRVRASLTECSVEDLVQRIRTGMRSQPRLCRRCGYNIDGLPEAR